MLNSNVRWEGQDAGGSFHHIGKCIAVDEDTVTIETQYGNMTLPVVEVKKTREARTKRLVAIEDKPVADVRPGSKAEKALEIVRSNPDASRKECIAMFMEQLGMSQAGASTYFSNAKKRL